MHESVPSRAFLTAQVRWVMGRGIPAQVAEDLVFDAWERAVRKHDPALGPLEALMHGMLRRDVAYWWRKRERDRHTLEQLRLVPTTPDTAREERASRLQAQLLDALSPAERAVFDAWALQRHLGKGRVTAVEISAALGLAVPDYENAKRRLRTRIASLLNHFGWSARTVLHGEDDDVERTGG